MDYKVNIISIEYGVNGFLVSISAFHYVNGRKCCLSFEYQEYVEYILRKWFGSIRVAKYGGDRYTYLCGK